MIQNLSFSIIVMMTPFFSWADSKCQEVTIDNTTLYACDGNPKYETLEACNKKCKAEISADGLSNLPTPNPNPGEVLRHPSSGESNGDTVESLPRNH